MKKNWVVTIGREFCSGGLEVAQKLSERLGVPYYDRDIVDHAVEITNLSREIVEENEEKGARRGESYVPSFYREDPTLVLPVHARIYTAQCDAIRRFAGRGSCVMVGRCADYVLGECANVVDVVSVFIRADLEKRVQRAMRIYQVSEVEARKGVLKTDKIRAKYYNAHTGRDWGSIGNYSLIVDTGEFGTDGAAGIIAAAVAELESREKGEL